jgi:putative endonuclease
LLPSGRHGEGIAAHYLALRGYTLLARNSRFADVEIDLLARDGTCLVLVEVKLRTHRVVPARDALSPQQERRLLRAASVLLARHDWAQQVRVDLVAIDHDLNAQRLHLEHLCGVLPR